MLRSLSMRLLPRRSGISSVFSSSTRTKPGRIAARRAVEPFGAGGGEREERRRLDEGAVLRADVVDLLGRETGSGGVDRCASSSHHGGDEIRGIRCLAIVLSVALQSNPATSSRRLG